MDEQHSSIIPRATLPEQHSQQAPLPQVQEAPVPLRREDVAPQVPLPVQVKTLLAWSAPGRPFRRRGKEYFVNILIIALALEVILFLFGQWMLMVLVASVVFLTFALATVPPPPFHYKISTEGITVEDHYYLWQELYDFYFKTIDGTETLILRTKSYLPGELTMTLGTLHKEQVKNALLPYLPYREYVKPTVLERSSDWLSKTFPLEKKASHSS